jgi:hypothetical protein
LTGSSRSFSSGTAEGETTITVSLGDNGSYSVHASTTSLKAMVTGETSRTSQQFISYCAIEDRSETQAHVPHEAILAGGSVGALGTVDPRTPYVLQGTKKVDIPAEAIDSQTTRRKSMTTTWNLRRN